MIWGAVIGAVAGAILNRKGNKANQRATQQAAQTQANAGYETARLQTEAAREAARLQSDTALQAAKMQTDAAREGAQLSHEGTMAGIGEQRRQYDQSRTDQLPWLQAGQRQLGVLEDKLPHLTQQFRGEDLASSPGYQFQLKQGMDAIGAQARALGIQNSGGTMQELLRYGQDYAGTKFQEAWSRDQAEKQSIYNMLSGISGTGQVTGQNLAAQGGAAANSIAGLLQSGANARAGALTAGAGFGANALMQGANASSSALTAGAGYGANAIGTAANAGAASQIAAGQYRAQNYNNLGNIIGTIGAMW